VIRPQSCGRIGRAFPDIQIQKVKERFGGICAARRGYAAWLLFAARALPLIDIGKGLPLWSVTIKQAPLSSIDQGAKKRRRPLPA
jgi:hypothetical protein